MLSKAFFFSGGYNYVSMFGLSVIDAYRGLSRKTATLRRTLVHLISLTTTSHTNEKRSILLRPTLPRTTHFL